jgi:hypothetical protein
MQDNGTPVSTLLRTRVELPGGSVAAHGGVIEGHLVGWGIPYDTHTPASYDLAITTVRDFGLEKRTATATIAPTTPPTTRQIAPVRDLGAASVAALQIEISDALTDEQWALDQLVLRVRREEDR